MSFLLKLEGYNVQQHENWPNRGRQIISQYDDDSVIVYGSVFDQIGHTFYEGRDAGTKYCISDVKENIGTEKTGQEVGIIEKIDEHANEKITSLSAKFEAETSVSTRWEKEEGQSEKFEAETSVSTRWEKEEGQTEKFEAETHVSTIRGKETNKSTTCEKETTVSTKCEKETSVSIKRESNAIVPQGIRKAASKVLTLIGKNKNEDNGKKQGNTSEFVWFHTSFVRKMYSCELGDGSDQEMILAVSMRRKGFDEILRTYVEDVQNNQESSEVLLEWYPDRSLTGGILERLVPCVGVKGDILRRFYKEWVLGIKDITQYIQRQKRFIQKGSPNLVWTPKEMTYIPDSIDICNVLGLTKEEDTESIPLQSFTETIGEIFAQLKMTEMHTATSQSREAILYFYGAFNPIHTGHVNALVEAKYWLENTAKYHVCDTRIAIASDSNIKEKFSKTNDLCFKFEHRLKLCELACLKHPWIKVCSVPVTSQPKYGKQLQRELNKPDATLVILMGSDRAILSQRRVNAARSENKFVLCIGREGMSSFERRYFEEAKKNDPNNFLDFFVVPAELNDISSTSIRQKLQKLNDGEMINHKKIINDLQVFEEMIKSSWITEEEGEYIFQNSGVLYLSS